MLKFLLLLNFSCLFVCLFVLHFHHQFRFQLKQQGQSAIGFANAQRQLSLNQAVDTVSALCSLVFPKLHSLESVYFLE